MSLSNRWAHFFPKIFCLVLKIVINFKQSNLLTQQPIDEEWRISQRIAEMINIVAKNMDNIIVLAKIKAEDRQMCKNSQYKRKSHRDWRGGWAETDLVARS